MKQILISSFLLLLMACNDSTSPIIMLVDESGETIALNEIEIEMDSAMLNFVMEVHVTEDKEIGQVSAVKRVNGGESIEMIPDELRIFLDDGGMVLKYIF